MLTALGATDQAEVIVPLERVAEVIADRDFLLVLDNCEHLVDACAALADGLLRRCPGLRVLTTSREALGVTGETAWLVPPLSLPAPGEAAIDGAEAVQLFVERARAVQPMFELTPDNRAAVAQICRRLDGLPLALELAAARLRVLGPEQIAARLDDRFRLLTTGNRAALPRHQTLRAAIDWSYDMLAPRERRLLARLAVFRGGFTLEAAEHVGSDAELRPDDVLDIVAELVEKSLVDMREGGDRARYQLLETMRQYGAERLAESGETDEMRSRHARHFVAFVAEAEPHLVTPRRPAWIAQLHPEIDNLRQALAWTREHDDATHVRLVGMLHWFWFATGEWPEARQWLRSALTCPAAELPTRDRAAVQFSAGSIASLQARSESALAHLVPAGELAASLGDERLLAYIRNYHAMALTQISSAAAEGPTLAAQAWFREAGDLYGLRLNLLLESTLRFFQGDLAAAIERGEEGVRIARVFGLDRELAISLQTLGTAVLKQGDVARATNLYRDALDAIRRDPQPLFMARSMEMVASCLALHGDAAGAARIHGAAAALRETIGARMWQLDAILHEPIIAAARAAIGDSAFDAAQQSGRAIGLDAAIDFALRAAEAHDGNVVEPTTDTAEYAVFTLPPADAPGAALRMQSLGSVEAWVDGVAVQRKAWGYAKVRELLVYLLLHPDGRTREQIGAALWPEASSAQVRNNFHVTLHTLRKVLGASDRVRFEGGRYRVDAVRGIDFDATRFRDAITPALRAARRGTPSIDELATALELYHGHFMDGEDAGDWHLAIRDDLARLAAEGLEALGEAQLEAKRFEDATATLERLVAHEPLHEAGWRALMRARAGAGDRAGVTRDFRRMEGVLRRELGEEPERESRELYRRLMER